MRDALRASIADRNPGFGGYPKGSIVLCNACALPLFVLDRSIGLGEKAGRGADAFRPITLNGLLQLMARTDIDPGIAAKLSTWTPAQRADHCHRIPAPRSGDPMACPACQQSWAQVRSTETTDTLDRAYVLELVTIPPDGYGAGVQNWQRKAGAWL